MKFYMAPMEGITGHIYRNAHQHFFHSIDKYFSPFIVANQQEGFKARAINDVLPDHNQGLHLVPQILANNAKDFINTSKKLKQLGYDVLNLNLGCPYGTVVSKNRGSGFLALRKELDEFLEEVFAASITKISIKTRIGKDAPEEFYDLIEIFNKYPLEELIIHPRIQKDFYENQPNLKVFRDALSLSKNPVCYNGDLFDLQAYQEFTQNFSEVDRVMIGRGLITNPGLVDYISRQERLTKEQLKAFHDKLCEDYKGILSGDRNVLFKMKELWSYMITMFTDHEKYAKKIKKSEKFRDYDAAVASLFEEQELMIK